MKKIAIALFWVLVITFWLTMLTTPRGSDAGRFEMRVFSDGEIVVFDSASGQARIIRRPQINLDHVPDVPQLVPDSDLPDDLKNQRSF